MGARIVNISDHGAYKERQLEECMERSIMEQYGKRAAVQNPIIRIHTKFDAMDNRGQLKLCGYAERCMMGRTDKSSVRDRFWKILELLDMEMWQDIERYADELLIEEMPHGASGRRAAKG